MRITELEHAIEILNDKIDKLSQYDPSENAVSSSDFPEKPIEGQYWTVGDNIF